MKEPPNLRLPQLILRGIICAIYWRCSCGHLHEFREWRDTFLTFFSTRTPKTIGEPCEACAVAPSHYICPHCHTFILLDATRPRTKAATYPEYVRPPREPVEERVASPLAGFDDLEP